MSSIPAPRAEVFSTLAREEHGAQRSSRVAAFALLACACALFGWSLHEPWWFFRLYAPQYPHGLTLIIALNGLSGDVREIDMLNHYIGMAHLDDAAVFERQYAAYAVSLLVLGLTAVAYWARRAQSWLLPAIGALFPLGFIADCMFWLYRFGHRLDPRAPLRLPVFTPQLFGNGTIGQFMTFARPERGFWLAVLAVLLLGAAALARVRVRSRRSQRATS